MEPGRREHPVKGEEEHRGRRSQLQAGPQRPALAAQRQSVDNRQPERDEAAVVESPPTSPPDMTTPMEAAKAALVLSVSLVSLACHVALRATAARRGTSRSWGGGNGRRSVASRPVSTDVRYVNPHTLGLHLLHRPAHTSFTQTPQSTARNRSRMPVSEPSLPAP